VDAFSAGVGATAPVGSFCAGCGQPFAYWGAGRQQFGARVAADQLFLGAGDHAAQAPLVRRYCVCQPFTGWSTGIPPPECHHGEFLLVDVDFAAREQTECSSCLCRTPKEDTRLQVNCSQGGMHFYGGSDAAGAGVEFSCSEGWKLSLNEANSFSCGIDSCRDIHTTSPHAPTSSVEVPKSALEAGHGQKSGGAAMGNSPRNGVAGSSSEK
jgi:hypothetical protein